MHSTFFSTDQKRKGQAMLLTILALGGSVLGATTIAGLLMVYQIRQATDLKDSTRAIFAADTGIEWALYQFVRPGGPADPPVFSNGASFEIKCYNDAVAEISCAAEEVTLIRSIGSSGEVRRAFELEF